MLLYAEGLLRSWIACGSVQSQFAAVSTAMAICIEEIFIQLVKTSVRESLSDRRLHSGNINKPAICHLLSDFLFFFLIIS